MQVEEATRIAKAYAKAKREGKDYEPHEGYTDVVNAYKAARVHAKGLFPEHLFRNAAPLMDASELKYLRDVYQPETKDVYVQFCNTLKRGLANGALHVESTGTNEVYADELREHLDEGIDNFDSLRMWMAALSDHKAYDGMGVFGVWPAYMPTERGEDGTEYVAGAPKPQPKLYPAPDVLYAENDVYVCKSPEKSEVLYQGKLLKVGAIIDVYTPTQVIQLRQVGRYNDGEFTVAMDYPHMVGYTPAGFLKGIAEFSHDRVIYIAPFQYAVPHLNAAALDSSNLLVIKRKVGYPTRVVVQEKCQYQDTMGTCEGGQIRVSDGDQITTHTCPNCKGTGYVGVFGPMSELRIASNQGFGETGPSVTASNAMSYVSPSVEIPKFLSEEVAKFMLKAEHAMHLKAEPRKSGDITATEKTINAKNTEAFVRPFSDQLWHIYQFIAESIGRMMFPEFYDDNISVTIQPPKSFDLVKPEDYVQAIAEATEAGLPPIIIQEMVYSYFREVGEESIGDIVAEADRLLGMSDQAVTLGLARQTVQPWEAVLHQSAAYIVYQLMRTVDNWADLDTEERVALIHAAAKALVPSTEFALPPPEL